MAAYRWVYCVTCGTSNDVLMRRLVICPIAGDRLWSVAVFLFVCMSLLAPAQLIFQRIFTRLGIGLCGPNRKNWVGWEPALAIWGDRLIALLNRSLRSGTTGLKRRFWYGRPLNLTDSAEGKIWRSEKRVWLVQFLPGGADSVLRLGDQNC